VRRDFIRGSMKEREMGYKRGLHKLKLWDGSGGGIKKKKGGQGGRGKIVYLKKKEV